MPRRDYVLDWQRTFAHPLYSIDIGDFDGDGVDELTCTSLQGVHVLKPDLTLAVDRLSDMTLALEEILELRAAAAQEASK